ncbi:beta,beta-carotene 15,15'-dioxygenase-like [Corticium candelabrum]|uniref:beta,beta-carotene 15,15'-dioxygenase-like n=1 Tax=Corticium candelabrum TaxID=121492 RepID=UPI002E267D2E|nr:beta,beta-carotene 15,15'-dioxygenase-like [Corticium candelabrum]
MAASFAKVFETATSDVYPPVSATVSGSIPSWLRGTLMRNGPAIFSVGPTSYRHWFDGQSMLHSFNIEDKNVTYTARFLQSDIHKTAQEAGRVTSPEFGTPLPPDPCHNIFRRFFSRFTAVKNDNANVNVVRVNDRWLALGEVPLLWHFDPETLEPVKRYSTGRAANLRMAHNTAHPHDAGDGEIYNIGTSVGSRPMYNLLRSRLVDAVGSVDGPTLQSDVLCSIPAGLSPSYYHSFARTENFVVFAEMPIKYSLLAAATMHIRGSSFADCLTWCEDTPTQFHVIDLRTNRELTATYHTDPFFTFHHVNAYEDVEHNQIIVDAICLPDTQLISDLYLYHLRSEDDRKDSEPFFQDPDFRRFFIPLDECGNEKTINVAYESLGCGGELPTINEKYNRKKYRYAYGLTRSTKERNPFDGLMKHDVDTKEWKEWLPGEGLYVSEPVFVASPDEASEDDGIILSAVISGDPSKSCFLAILDAASFTLLAKAEVPCRIAGTFHGRFTSL